MGCENGVRQRQRDTYARTFPSENTLWNFHFPTLYTFRIRQFCLLFLLLFVSRRFCPIKWSFVHAIGIGENFVNENQTINELIIILNFKEANVTHLNTSEETDNTSALATKWIENILIKCRKRIVRRRKGKNGKQNINLILLSVIVRFSLGIAVVLASYVRWAMRRQDT